MRFSLVALGLGAALASMFTSRVSRAQGLPSQSLTRGTWEFEPFIGGGTGLLRSSNTQFVIAGARVGNVVTGEHLHGWARGDFEFAADFMPLYLVMQPGGTVYGASFKPVIFKWNFTSNHKIAPYALIAGGVLFTTSNVPPGNTSYVNFTPQGALGFHIFTRPKRAWDFEIQFVHHSNASLGTLNPGLNASVLFTVGYNWFK
ncbi:MAG TPA: acyloxyacyl hydrolase [Candidatus Acidoferrales bacterium]|nr:acyloxyacyl hydrolase [Candidatus Acidoferrales bacterium]